MKLCCRCKNDKHPNEFSFDKSRRDGKSNICRSCVQEFKTKNRIRRPGNRDKAYERERLRKYNLTSAEFAQLFLLQGSRCAGCGIQFTDHTKLQVDHCHSTNVVRGLLCRPCNTALGFVKDDIKVLKSLIKYVSSKRAGATVVQTMTPYHVQPTRKASHDSRI